MRSFRWIAAAALFGIGLLFAACPFLPTVNAPMTNSIFGWGIEPPSDDVVGSRLRVPEGFSISIHAEIPKVRFLRPTPAGDLIATVPREGKVMLVERDRDGDRRPDAVRVLLDGLDRPHGVDLHDGWLYIAEGTAVGRARFDVEAGRVEGALTPIVTDLPDGGNHWTRTARVGPDDGLYIAIGSSCNVCFEEDEERAAMVRTELDGSGRELYAIGLRNAVGFAWQPGTDRLFATDNGRDLLGDDFPPCELNEVVRGGDYGWPVANGAKVIDPDLGAGHEARIEASIAPAFDFPAHNAPLGIDFLAHPDTPAPFRGDALVALHGSWNRSEKDGYKVVALSFDGDAIRSSDFATGFLVDEDVIGRPVDVAQGPDGTIFISDDYAGVIYRVSSKDAGTGLARASDGAGDADPLAPLSDAERAAGRERGALLYTTHACASCHDAAEAEPGVVVAPLEDLAGRYDLDALASFFTAPTPPMPAFPLSDAERRDLAIYLLASRED